MMKSLTENVESCLSKKVVLLTYLLYFELLSLHSRCLLVCRFVLVHYPAASCKWRMSAVVGSKHPILKVDKKPNTKTDFLFFNFRRLPKKQFTLA